MAQGGGATRTCGRSRSWRGRVLLLLLLPLSHFLPGSAGREPGGFQWGRRGATGRGSGGAGLEAGSGLRSGADGAWDHVGMRLLAARGVPQRGASRQCSLEPSEPGTEAGGPSWAALPSPGRGASPATAFVGVMPWGHLPATGAISRATGRPRLGSALPQVPGGRRPLAAALKLGARRLPTGGLHTLKSAMDDDAGEREGLLGDSSAFTAGGGESGFEGQSQEDFSPEEDFSAFSAGGGGAGFEGVGAGAVEVREQVEVAAQVGKSEKSRKEVDITLDGLLEKIREYCPTADFAKITKAYDFAERMHSGQLRRSGEPYFIHPCSVASIICDMKLDTASIITGLLHDTVEDTVASIELIEEEFGAEVAQLVDGVTKIGKITFNSKEEAQAENFRKMVVAMARDIRVILVKLADRTHNIRTLKHVPAHKQKEVARETLELYAPLAHRLGIFWLKTELEDTSLRFLHPEVYAQLKMHVNAKKQERQNYTEEVMDLLRQTLISQGLQTANVTGRAKHFYSIFQKMQSRGLGFDEVQDLIAFRILIDDNAQCYQALGIVHTMFKPVPGRFKDYIALPKPNMYRSLHTTVIGPAGQRVEVQIRTREMHQVAEEGIAAHWMYKGESHAEMGVEEARRFAWLRQLVEWVQQLNDPQEFLHSVKEDLFEKEVFVFSPKGDLYALPKGSSIIDFAYRVHSELGNHCMGGRVNGRMVQLKYQLANGDTVEVITSPNQVPRREWLGMARTSKAQARVRAWLKGQQREKSVSLGRVLLEKELKFYVQRNLDVAHKVDSGEYKERMTRVLAAFNLKEEEQLLAALGYGQVTVQDFLTAFFADSLSGWEADTEALRVIGEAKAAIMSNQEGDEKDESEGVLVGGQRNMLIQFCKQCAPLHGEHIKGIITRGSGIKVHGATCEILLESDAQRVIGVAWDSSSPPPPRAVEVEVECTDAPGMLASMSRAIGSVGVNIGGVVLKKLIAGTGLARFEVFVSTMEEMQKVISALESETGVLRVARGALSGRKDAKRRTIKASVVPSNLMSDM